VILSFLKVLLVAVSFAYLGLALMAVFLTPRMLYPVPPPGYDIGADTPLITMPDGTRIATMYLPAPDATKVVLYHHGNGEDLGSVRERLKGFQARGYAAFGYDYPGYGRSEGQPTEGSLIAAGETALEHLQSIWGWDPENIVHYGHSLGGGPAIALGERYPSAGVIVEGTFTSVFRVMTRVRLLPWDVFNNLGRVTRLQAPLLVVHGTEDATVPFRHGQRLAAAAPDAETLWVEGAHHVNVWEVAGEAFWDRLAHFTGHPSDASPHSTEN
jgi:fermentation-respiration switch protein FrsA (DUF1100 family)